MLWAASVFFLQIKILEWLCASEKFASELCSFRFNFIVWHSYSLGPTKVLGGDKNWKKLFMYVWVVCLPSHCTMVVDWMSLLYKQYQSFSTMHENTSIHGEISLHFQRGKGRKHEGHPIIENLAQKFPIGQHKDQKRRRGDDGNHMQNNC